jgi:hypothetical protein
VKYIDAEENNTWLRRKNIYNEEEEQQIGAYEEDNMVVATWANDLGNNH